MTKPELQTKILNNSRSLFQLVSAISRLPESETRGELIYNHNKILERLANLQADLGLIDRNACYYGFTDKCPGMVCCECKYLLGEQSETGNN